MDNGAPSSGARQPAPWSSDPFGFGAAGGNGTNPRDTSVRGPSLRTRLVLAALLAVPLAEILLLIQMFRWIGWWTLAILVVGAVVGTWLARREGVRTWRAVAEASAEGRTPTRELLDSLLVTVGGGALIFPGLITDVIALFLLLPFTRPLARRGLMAYLRRRFGNLQDRVDTHRGRMNGTVIEGEVITDN